MRVLWLIVPLLWASSVAAAELREVRLWAGPDGTRVVFELDEPAEHTLFTLEGPERVVIDLSSVRRNQGLVLPDEPKGVIRRVRSGKRAKGLRVVLDLEQKAKPKSFVLPPNGGYGYRLVVDLAAPARAAEPQPAVEMVEKPIVVAIDAGHGGEDPGARGRNGTLEKDVALQLARRLARLVNAEPGLKAVLIRDGDYYIGLRERIAKARAAQADLFVSIHANSYKDPKVRGTAVYVLSPNGASSEHARWLASRENAADLIGGVEIQDKDDTLAAVLIDISQTSAREASFDVGSRLLEAMGQVNVLQRPKVQQAGFVVLKAPDIPSVLVETAFISNAQEERLLTDRHAQEKLAQSMLEGIRGYFASYRPQQQYALGDTRGGLQRTAFEAVSSGQSAAP